MQVFPRSVTDVLPANYHITKCQTKPDGTCCECYTAVKDVSNSPVCKVHGDNADMGAKEVLEKVRGAGYIGPVLTQFPIHSEGNKNVSRQHASMYKSTEGRGRKGQAGKGKGGQFQTHVRRLDIVLCSTSCSRLAAIEVQGEDHADGRVIDRDSDKRKVMDCVSSFRLFEMHGKKPRSGNQEQAGASSESRRSKRTTVPSVKLQNTLSPQRSIAHEVVAFLR